MVLQENKTSKINFQSVRAMRYLYGMRTIWRASVKKGGKL